MKSKYFLKSKIDIERGFTLSVALIMTTIILAISFSISTIIAKSVKISGLATEGAGAYLSAEVGIDCVRTLEDATLSIQKAKGEAPIGLFSSPTDADTLRTIQNNISNTTVTANVNTNNTPNTSRPNSTTNLGADLPITSFNCGGGAIVANSGNLGSATVDGSGYAITRISVKSTDTNRCSDIEIYKSDDGSMIIVSRGYSKCSGSDRIARELRVTIN